MSYQKNNHLPPGISSSWYARQTRKETAKMSHRMLIPKGAILEFKLTGTINQGLKKGKKAELKIWSVYASKGYKSHFQPILTKYSQSNVEGERQSIRSYTGSNIPKLNLQIEKIKKIISKG